MEEEQKTKFFTETLKTLEENGLIEEFIEYMNKEKEKKDILSNFGWLECI